MKKFGELFSFIKNDRIHGAMNTLGMKFNEVKPELMLVTGAISLFIGTIEACRKTKECEKVIENARNDFKNVDEQLKLPDPESGIEVLPETIKQNKVEKGRQYVKICAKTAYDLIKIYGIPALFWFGGMGFVIGDHSTLRKDNKRFIAQIFASTQALNEYRNRVSKAVGPEIEEKIFQGVQEGMVNVLETNDETGEKQIVQKKVDEFYAQPGSIFARNFTPSTTDLMYRASQAQYDEYLESRIEKINLDLSTGYLRAMTGMDILRRLGFDENALGSGDELEALLTNGISANARLVPDPSMRELKVTKLRGYEKKWDVARDMEVWEPCLRLDFNFYPLSGRI